MQGPAAKVGDMLEDVDTPALVLDLDAFDRNIRSMAEFMEGTGAKLRPHAKTHKCVEIARRQLASGAVGQCVQKVGEAEVLVDGGIKSVLVSNEVVGKSKLRRLALLAKKADIALCFDCLDQVNAASIAAKEAGVTLGGLVEIEVGMKRCGVPVDRRALEIASCIAKSSNLRFLGLQAYNGRAQHLKTHAERSNAVGASAALVRDMVNMLQAEGLECEIIGGGGTGTFRQDAESQVYNEIQAGSYVFMDGEYGGIEDESGGAYREFENSLFVIASVMSVPDEERVVLDAGLKSLTIEKGLPAVYRRDDMEIMFVADEHSVARRNPRTEVAVGEKMLLIPGHCDPTVNLHDWYIGVRGGIIEEVWAVDARGASR